VTSVIRPEFLLLYYHLQGFRQRKNGTGAATALPKNYTENVPKMHFPAMCDLNI